MSLRAEAIEAMAQLERALRADPNFAVLIRSPRCPACWSGQISTWLDIRTHRCRECGHAWEFTED